MGGWFWWERGSVRGNGGRDWEFPVGIVFFPGFGGFSGESEGIGRREASACARGAARDANGHGDVGDLHNMTNQDGLVRRSSVEPRVYSIVGDNGDNGDSGDMGGEGSVREEGWSAKMLLFFFKSGLLAWFPVPFAVNCPDIEVVAMSMTLPALVIPTAALVSAVETDGLSRPLLLVFILAALALTATAEPTDRELAFRPVAAATGLDACIIASARSLPTIASTCCAISTSLRLSGCDSEYAARS